MKSSSAEKVIVTLAAHRDGQRVEDGGIEALAGREVAHDLPDVVDQATAVELPGFHDVRRCRVAIHQELQWPARFAPCFRGVVLPRRPATAANGSSRARRRSRARGVKRTESPGAPEDLNGTA
jgi:hypothetical protein